MNCRENLHITTMRKIYKLTENKWDIKKLPNFKNLESIMNELRYNSSIDFLYELLGIES